MISELFQLSRFPLGNLFSSKNFLCWTQAIKHDVRKNHRPLEDELLFAALRWSIRRFSHLARRSRCFRVYIFHEKSELLKSFSCDTICLDLYEKKNKLKNSQLVPVNFLSGIFLPRQILIIFLLINILHDRKF